MSDPVRDAKQLVQADMERFEQTLADTLAPQAEYLTEAEYETYRRGKKIRPLMMILSARTVTADGTAPLPAKVIKGAVSLEMLHVATLIHDDIVDVAPTRRGLQTVYAERGPEMAVLIGDMQFIQAIRCFVDGVDAQKDMELVRLVLNVGFDLCRGELDEILTDPSSGPVELEHRYFRTVERKTATLFGMACEAGAWLVDSTEKESFKLGRFGRRFGTAFQIMDDIFDIVRPEEYAGKAPGIDLMQARLSLPVLYAMQELPQDHVLRRIVNKESHTEADIREAIDAITGSRALLRAYSKARELALEGIDFLSWFAESPYRAALEAIASHVVDRSFDSPD